MKQIFVVLLSLMLITSSCMKHRLGSSAPVNENVGSAAALVYKATFENGRYGKVSGIAEIYKQGSGYVVQLKNFTTTNGPALHVMLSQEATPVHYLDLGPLKSTNGNQVYTISGNPDFSSYRFVSIHCVEYNHLFGYAALN